MELLTLFVAAVDLNQFRNEEVSVGYQATGVIRQKGKNSGSRNLVSVGNKGMNIMDMSKKIKKDDGSL